MTHVLRKSIGAWSAGTRVQILNWQGNPDTAFEMPDGMLEVRVLAGDRPIIDVPEDIVIERRRGRDKKMG